MLVGLGPYINILFSETEYDRMPPLYHMDDFEGCLQQPSGLYCTVHFSLVSDTPSELLDMIKVFANFSRRINLILHLNHDRTKYGIV